MSKEMAVNENQKIDFENFKNEVIADYKLACESREASLLGRREVLSGKAKFGIFGDGKEVAQIALAKQFKNGDFRSGYYRDQTIMLAIGQLNIQQFFAALYAQTDVEQEPSSAGRQMGGHYATRNIDEKGNKIKEDIIVVAEGTLFEAIQSKEVNVIAEVKYFDLRTGQKINNYPLESLFIFENRFANFEGDKRVLNKDESFLLTGGPVKYPTHEQMLTDASENIKAKLKQILKNQIGN
jgi:hypothetical protein